MATGEAPEAEENEKKKPEKNQPEGWKLPKAAAISQRKAHPIRWKWAKPKEPRKRKTLGLKQPDAKRKERATVEAPDACPLKPLTRMPPPLTLVDYMWIEC